MGKRQRHSIASGANISWAISFLGLLLLIILGSFIWKVVVFLRHSTFDGGHQFTITVTGENPRLIAFNPDQSEATVVALSGKDESAQTLSVPIDGTITGNGDSGVQGLLFSALLHHSTTLSPVDLVKLWWFTITLPKDGITSVSLSSNEEVALQQIPKLFQDKTLYSEGKSITVVNAAGVSGLGSKVAKLLTNIGANVIMVSTADSEQTTSSIRFTGDASYTLHRLERIFHLTAQQSQSNSGISDITVTIGKDLGERDIF